MTEYKFPHVGESSRGSNFTIVKNLSFREDLIMRLKVLRNISRRLNFAARGISETTFNFDVFSLFVRHTKKYLEQNSREIVDHLHQAISRVTKFMLGKEVSENAELAAIPY